MSDQDDVVREEYRFEFDLDEETGEGTYRYWEDGVLVEERDADLDELTGGDE